MSTEELPEPTSEPKALGPSSDAAAPRVKAFQKERPPPQTPIPPDYTSPPGPPPARQQAVEQPLAHLGMPLAQPPLLAHPQPAGQPSAPLRPDQKEKAKGKGKHKPGHRHDAAQIRREERLYVQAKEASRVSQSKAEELEQKLHKTSENVLDIAEKLSRGVVERLQEQLRSTQNDLAACRQQLSQGPDGGAELLWRVALLECLNEITGTISASQLNP